MRAFLDGGVSGRMSTYFWMDVFFGCMDTCMYVNQYMELCDDAWGVSC